MQVLPCKRWAVVYDHDGAPVDGNLYIHKAKAESRLSGFTHPEKMRVEQVAVMSAQMAEALMRQAHG